MSETNETVMDVASDIVTKPAVTKPTTGEVDEILAELDALEQQLDARAKKLGEEIESFPSFGDDLTAEEEASAALRALSSDDLSAMSPAELEKLHARIEQIEKKLKEIDVLESQVRELRAFVGEKLSVDIRAMYANILEQMNVEAVKIYRNLQAVVVEENARQNRALFGIDGKSDSLKKRMNNVIIFSIVSFVVSILVMLMQILPAFGINILK